MCFCLIVIIDTCLIPGCQACEDYGECQLCEPGYYNLYGACASIISFNIHSIISFLVCAVPLCQECDAFTSECLKCQHQFFLLSPYFCESKFPSF